MIQAQELESVVQKWLTFKADFTSRSGQVTQDQIREFQQRSNRMGNELVSAVGTDSVEWLEALAEVAMNAAAVRRMPDVMRP